MPEGDTKRQAATTLQTKYANDLTGTANIAATRKDEMIQDLKAAKQKFSTHRNLKFIAGEILGFIGLVGVGYLIAASIKGYKTGHFGLFAQPKTEGKVDAIAELAEAACHRAANAA